MERPGENNEGTRKKKKKKKVLVVGAGAAGSYPFSPSICTYSPFAYQPLD